jgi:hypothetical protein
MHFQFKHCFRLEYLNSTPPPWSGGGMELEVKFKVSVEVDSNVR